MFDWLKFFPLAERFDHKPSEVRGPYLSTPRKRKWLLGDNVLHFSAPRANPVFSFFHRSKSVDAISPGPANILTTEREDVDGLSDAPYEWDTSLFYSNTWYFVGPWFTGVQTRLKAKALLVSARQGTNFSEKNLFHPRVFEGAIAGFLDNWHGYSRTGSKPDYRAPLNWQVMSVSDSIQAVVCDVHFIANGGREDPDLYRRIYIPVTPQRFIQISFDLGSLRNKIKGKPLLDLCNSIINSFRLEVGANTKAEWDKVKADCPDMSITKTFGELRWPLIKKKPSKKRKEVDITPEQNPQGHDEKDLGSAL